jgi:hypothetical protein
MTKTAGARKGLAVFSWGLKKHFSRIIQPNTPFFTNYKAI